MRSGSPLGSGSYRLTLLLVAASIVVGVMTKLGDKPSGLKSQLFISSFWFRDIWQVPWLGLVQIQQGQVWRLITPIFLHFGVTHLLFNMTMLFQLGGAIESRQGTIRLALIVFSAAALSNVAQYLYHGPNFGGMSGVNYALFGYMWMQSRFVPGSGLVMPQELVFLMLFWFVICLSGTVGDVADMAHGAGLACGMILGLMPRWRRIGSTG